MHPTCQTWRVRGIPLDFDKRRLAGVLQHHPSLQITKTAGVNEEDNDRSDNDVWVHTLAPDLWSDQVTTICFCHLPVQLDTLEHNGQLPIDIQVSSMNTHTGVKEKRDSLQTVRLAIDQHFNGITVLCALSTSEHQIDVVAVSGLGSHPFGSFVHKGDGHMWLSNSLPQDMPMARVMIYAYKSGLQGSNSFAHLGDLASSLQITVYQLLRSEKKHLVLIGHSLGRLLIKEALI
jgi:protein SERAC1